MTAEICEVCGRERTAWAPEKTLGAFVVPWAEAAKCWNGNDGADDREHWRLGYEREKARADDEYERAEMFQRDARRSDAALVAERARAEKAEAALEAENLGAKAEQGRLADALVAERARAEKAEADEAIAWSEVHDHEAVIRNFEKSVAKLQAALAAARQECEGLRDRVREVRADMTPTNMQYEAPYLRQWIVSWARKLDAALAAPAAGEEGKHG